MGEKKAQLFKLSYDTHSHMLTSHSSAGVTNNTNDISQSAAKCNATILLFIHVRVLLGHVMHTGVLSDRLIRPLLWLVKFTNSSFKATSQPQNSEEAWSVELSGNTCVFLQKLYGLFWHLSARCFDFLTLDLAVLVNSHRSHSVLFHPQMFSIKIKKYICKIPNVHCQFNSGQQNNTVRLSWRT